MRVEEVFEAERGRILATLIRLLGDFDVAEEALQEALTAALEQWPVAGTPGNPAAWLISTARHKAIDRLRRRARLAQMQDEIARHIELIAEEEAPVPEDRLRLIQITEQTNVKEAKKESALRTACSLPHFLRRCAREM